ncbi:MAG: sulfite exporter TauE/SafE family protein [Pseudomonadota bacterium]
MIAELSFLPDGMAMSVFLALLSASFLSSFITVAFGIGGGALLLAIMASLVPVSALIPVHGLIQLGSNAGRMVMLLKSVAWHALPGFAVGSLVGCILGGVVVVELPAEAVQIGIGLFVIWSVFSRPPAWLRRWPVVTGGISSFLTMFFGATGLFVANFTKSLDLPRHAHVATHATMMTLQHGLKVVVFGLLGFSFATWGGFVLAMIAVGVAGTLAGRLFLDRLPEHWFRRALDTLLVLISMRLIAGGLGWL